jgi:hypothetical protein
MQGGADSETTRSEEVTVAEADEDHAELATPIKLMIAMLALLWRTAANEQENQS